MWFYYRSRVVLFVLYFVGCRWVIKVIKIYKNLFYFLVRSIKEFVVIFEICYGIIRSDCFNVKDRVGLGYIFFK